MAAGYDGSIKIDTKINSSGFNTGVKSISSGLNGIMKSLKGVAVAVGIAFGVKALVNFSKEAISLASDLEEVQNVVDTVFGSSASSINEFAKTAIQQFGLSELAAKQYASTMGAMLKSMGLGRGEVLEMSQTLAGLAGDMASFYNLDADEAFNKIRSGISGETEPLKQLGINLSQANLEAFALSKGMKKAYSSMSESEKVLVRYNYLLSVTSDAQGDFARTSDSWANQTRILSMQWESFMSILGSSLITVLTPVIRFLNGVVAKLIEIANMINAFVGALFGKQNEIEQGANSAAIAEDNLADSVGGVGDAAEEAGKKAKSALASFDELNVLAQDNGTGNSEISAGSGIEVAELTGNIGEDVEVSPKLLDGINKLKELLEPAIEAAERLWEQLKRLGSFAWEGLKDFYNTFLVPVGEWVLGEGLPRFFDIIANGLAKVDWQKINDALHKLWEALTPFAINIGEGLLWFLENVLVPWQVWALNNIIPLIIEGIAASIDILNGVINALKPLGEWLWKNFLKPIAEWTGGVIVDVLTLIVDCLQDFSTWINENQEAVQVITVTVAAFFAAWEVTSLGAFIINAGGVVGVLGNLASALYAATAAKVANQIVTAKLVALYAKDFAVALANNIVNLAADTAAWISSTAAKVANTAAQVAMTAATTAWTAICTVATTVTSAFSAAVAFLTSPIGLVIVAIGALIAIIVLLIENWDKVKETAKNVWDNVVILWEKLSGWFDEKVWTPFKDGLKDTGNFFIKIINGMISGFEGLVNFFISGINAIIDGFNEISFSIPDWVPLIGGNTWGFNLNNIDPISLGKIPLLATGAVIPPNQKFMAVLGDQKSGRNLEAPEGLIRQIMREELAGLQTGGTDVTITFDGNLAQLARVLNPAIKKEERRIGSTLRTGGVY